jgi:UDP-2,4-diacetamido-2,4,6-trideoxy-beta-L-altropyranose hydrolase
MNIAFRMDATRQIGTGHFMRCLTLAEELKNQGARIRFVCRDLPVHLSEMLKAKGMELAALDSQAPVVVENDLAHSHWLGASQAQDAQDTLQALSDQHWDWVVVDHYALDARWELRINKIANKIIVIDDIADRWHDCDVLLDQNYYADMHTRYDGKVPARCQRLLGPRYALLRGEFRRLREQIKPRTGSVKKIFVFFGGVDADNYTGLALEALVALGNPVLQVDVVIGAQHPHREQIQKTCIAHGYVCHVQTTRMAELMAVADLAIGAGGSASWERCCLGLSAILVALAENQIDIAKALDSIGACVYIGTRETLTNSLTIQKTISRLLNAHDQLKMISQNASALVDGMGVSRVCHELGL